MNDLLIMMLKTIACVVLANDKCKINSTYKMPSSHRTKNTYFTQLFVLPHPSGYDNEASN